MRDGGTAGTHFMLHMQRTALYAHFQIEKTTRSFTVNAMQPTGRWSEVPSEERRAPFSLTQLKTRAKRRSTIQPEEESRQAVTHSTNTRHGTPPHTDSFLSQSSTDAMGVTGGTRVRVKHAEEARKGAEGFRPLKSLKQGSNSTKRHVTDRTDFSSDQTVY